MGNDWVDNEGMSREETLKRFRALDPQATRGPHVPGGGQFLSAPQSYGGATFTRILVSSAPALVQQQQPVGM